MAEMDFNQVLEWLKEEMEKLNEQKIENIPSFNIPEPFLSVIEKQEKEIKKQHFEILALEANLKGNDKIIQKQQMEIDSLTLDKGYLLEENKDLKEHRDNLNSIIFDLEKEIAKWKEKEFAACSKHHEFIDDIERLEKEVKSWKNCLREHEIILSDKYSEITKLQEEIGRWKKISHDLVSTYSNRNEILRDENKILYENIERLTVRVRELSKGNNLTTGQRLKEHLDKNAKEYYKSIIEETKSILEQDEIENKLKNMTVLQLAQLLEDGLLNACWLDEDMSVLEFIKDYL